MNESKKNSIKFMIVAIICICVFSISIVNKELQNDTFYTIKLGELILDNGIDMQEHFAWHEGLPYTYPHWLYDVIIYLIFLILGFEGLYISTIILTAILGVTIYLSNIKLTKNVVIPFFTTVCILYIGREFLATRAQLVTFILFVLEIYYIERFLETKKIMYSVGLLVIPILIANVHAAVFPFYFVLYMPYICEYIISIFISNKSKKEPYKIIIENNKNVKWLIIIMLFALLTGLLTPIGETPYTYLYNTLQGGTTKDIQEHLPIVLYETKDVLAYIIIVVCLIALTKVKIKLSDFILIGGLILLTIMSRRQQSMLFFLGILVVNKILSQIFSKEETNEMLITFTSTTGRIIIYMVFVVFLIFSLKSIGNVEFISSNQYPINAAEYIKNNLDLQNIKLFNDYNTGSYLLYKDIPVFIDSRADVYDSAFNNLEDDIFNNYLDLINGNSDYEQKFEYYGITHILIYENSTLGKILKMDENYNKLYDDNIFVIYERVSI